MFFTSNVVSGTVFHYMARQSLKLNNLSFILSTIFQVFFFGVTEALPVISFVKVNQTFNKVMDRNQGNGENNLNERENLVADF